MDYKSNRWKNKRKHILFLDKNMCVLSNQLYGKRIEGNTVHHIYPSKEYPQYAFCDWNLITVSPAMHNKLENRLTGELTNLGKWLQARTIPGKNWRIKDPAPF